MRIFVFESVTGGGLLGADLPASLVREGDMMLQALVGDLAAVDGVECIVTRDARLAAPRLSADCRVVHGAAAFPRVWAQTLAEVDAVWPIAPEHQGTLEAISRQVLAAGRLLLNSTPAAVRTTASKLQTLRVLADWGVPVVPTFGRQDPLPMIPGPWVLKPDDGVGCLGIRLCRDRDALSRYWEQLPDGSACVAQPFVQGTAASLSLLVKDGEATLLSVNRQRIAVMDDELLLLGCVVNGLGAADARFRRLGGDVAAALPGLWGYVGVDLVATAAGPLVLEVNPRLTTSYVGLRESLGVNPARLVLDLLSGWAAPAGVGRGPGGGRLSGGCRCRLITASVGWAGTWAGPTSRPSSSTAPAG